MIGFLFLECCQLRRMLVGICTVHSCYVKPAGKVADVFNENASEIELINSSLFSSCAGTDRRRDLKSFLVGPLIFMFINFKS